MSLGIRELLIVAVLSAAAAFAASRAWLPGAQVVTHYQTVPIDSTGWVRRAALESQRDIVRSLRADNESLADALRGSRDRIAALSRVEGLLRIERDSLITQIHELAVDPRTGSAIDTTYTFTGEFGDGLFQAKSLVGLSGVTLIGRIELVQLRPLRIDVATTLSDDQARVLTYVSSPDFAELNFTTYTALEPKRMKAWHWLAIGAAGGAITITLIR